MLFSKGHTLSEMIERLLTSPDTVQISHFERVMLGLRLKYQDFTPEQYHHLTIIHEANLIRERHKNAADTDAFFAEMWRKSTPTAAQSTPPAVEASPPEDELSLDTLATMLAHAEINAGRPVNVKEIAERLGVHRTKLYGKGADKNPLCPTFRRIVAMDRQARADRRENYRGVGGERFTVDNHDFDFDDAESVAEDE